MENACPVQLGQVEEVQRLSLLLRVPAQIGAILMDQPYPDDVGNQIRDDLNQQKCFFGSKEQKADITWHVNRTVPLTSIV